MAWEDREAGDKGSSLSQISPLSNVSPSSNALRTAKLGLVKEEGVVAVVKLGECLAHLSSIYSTL